MGPTPLQVSGGIFLVMLNRLGAVGNGLFSVFGVERNSPMVVGCRSLGVTFFRTGVASSVIGIVSKIRGRLGRTRP